MDAPTGCGTDADSPVHTYESTTFGSLIDRAKLAHNLEVTRLKEEVQKLHDRLAATCQERNDSCADTPGKRHATALPVGMQSARPASNVSAKLDINGSGPGGAATNVTEPGVASITSLHSRWSPCSTERGRPDASMATNRSGTKSYLSVYSHEGTRKSLARGFSSTFRRQKSREKTLAAKGCVYKLVVHPGFEMLAAGVIVLNGLVMALESQYHGFDVAVWTGHESARGLSYDVWPFAEEVFETCEWAFGVFFSLEVGLRILAHRSQFVRDCWNLIDLAVVVMWAYGRVNLGTTINAQMLRLLRLSRLVRLFRLFRYVNNHIFDSLYLIATALKGSGSILAWSFSLLLVLHALLALAVNQALLEWYFQEDQAEEQRLVFEYFGSFPAHSSPCSSLPLQIGHPRQGC